VIIAVEAGNIKTLQVLRERGVDMDIGDYDRRTALHIAVRAERIDVIRYLVGVCQVKINQIDRWGATPLNYATKGSEIYLYLMSRGAILGNQLDKITVR
jgi:glutaminase